MFDTTDASEAMSRNRSGRDGEARKVKFAGRGWTH